MNTMEHMKTQRQQSIFERSGCEDEADKAGTLLEESCWVARGLSTFEIAKLAVRNPWSESN